MKLLLVLTFTLLLVGCSTKNKTTTTEESKTVPSNYDSTRISNENGYQDNSIFIGESDSVKINGHVIYFSKHDSVNIPDLFEDQNTRQKITHKLSNSHDRAKAIEKYLQGKYNRYFNANDSTLTLFLEDSKTITLPKWDYITDTGNNFENYFEKENYFLIFNQWAEGNGWMLVNRKTGYRKYIIGEPYFSPNKRKILSINEDLYAQFSPNGIELLEVSGDTLVSKFTIEVKNWGAVGVRWISDTTAILETRILATDPTDNVDKKGFILMTIK